MQITPGTCTPVGQSLPLSVPAILYFSQFRTPNLKQAGSLSHLGLCAVFPMPAMFSHFVFGQLSPALPSGLC